MSTDDGSLVRDVSEAVGHTRLGFLPDACQLDLLRGDNGKVSQEDIATARSAGRPKGARNKRNKKLSQYIINKFGDPIDALGNLATMPLADLRQVLVEAQGGTSKASPVRAIDVLSLQTKATLELLTYVHGRQATSVDVTGRTDAIILMPGLNAPTDVSQEDLAAALERRGLDALDTENLTLLPEADDLESDVAEGDDDPA